MASAPFVSPAELAAIDPDDLVLLDVRHAYPAGGQPDAYAAGHLPGARYVELKSELAGPKSESGARNPLPEPAAIEASLRAWGVADGKRVVVYADADAPSAGRAWWVLTWAGVPEVRILEGGWQAWVAEGRALTTETPAPAEPGDFVVRPGQLTDIGPDEAAELAAEGRLVDARGAEYFELDPENRATGHIPGAVSVPYDALFASDGSLLDADGVRARFADAGIDLSRPVGLYCGGGVAAAFEASVLAGLGVETALYVGSWSEWASDPVRPRA
ncbi:MAG TPA: rhodanese-like domain-containing protein [Microbacteriaceae bacterium]|nr:rhodanese-like domain-containing protein [Microbacteriaceae bacterium]